MAAWQILKGHLIIHNQTVLTSTWLQASFHPYLPEQVGMFLLPPGLRFSLPQSGSWAGCGGAPSWPPAGAAPPPGGWLVVSGRIPSKAAFAHH